MMPSETTQTDLDWSRLQGTVLEGGYQLESILSADAAGATFKVRVLGDASANAIAKLFGMDAANAAEQAALWESTRELDNTNLLTPLGAGRTQVDGASVAYLVLRRPDEVLEAAIRERPLNTQEAGEVLLAVIRGLDELHSHGFVQGSLSPEHIMAAGDAIKLSVECVGRRGFAPRLHLREPKYRAPESAGQYVTPEADVWCLGATLIEILSQQPCGDDCMAQAAKLPAPFDGIARRCLDPDPETRPKLGQVEVMYRSSAAPPPAEPKKFEVPVSATAAPAGVTARVPVPNRISQSRPPQRRTPAVAAWMYAAAAVAVIVLLVWIARPKHRTIASTAHVTGTSTASSQPSAWESKTITPDDAKTVTSARASAFKPTVPVRQSQLVNGAVWRVVLYTYARSADADNKARSVNEKYPGLNAETFSPGGKNLYLVVVGGRMSREDAEHMRQRVRAMGLPRDSYVQNFQQ